MSKFKQAETLQIKFLEVEAITIDGTDEVPADSTTKDQSDFDLIFDMLNFLRGSNPSFTYQATDAKPDLASPKEIGLSSFKIRAIVLIKDFVFSMFVEVIDALELRKSVI